MSRLKDKINSDFFKAKNNLNKSKGELEQIAVFVESYDDILFWKDIFDKCSLQTKIHLASRTSLERGKSAVLKHNVGKLLILCVDSDYDYLLQDHTNDSKLINSNPYIFQTYTYSIENFKCYAESLHGVVIKATLQDEPHLFDYNNFLKEYSLIIYDLFIHLLHHIKEQSNSFKPQEFLDLIKLNKVDIKSQGKKELLELDSLVKNKIATFNGFSDTQITQFKNDLYQLGVKPENTYLFIKRP